MSAETLISKLEQLQERLEQMADRCNRQQLRIEEGRDGLQTIKNDLRAVLPPDSNAFRIFERMSRENTEWWGTTPSGYTAISDCAHFQRWLDIIQAVLNEIEPEFLRAEKGSKKQYFISAGDNYKAKKLIWKLMSRATHSLAVVDTYLDDTIFDYIESLNPEVAVQLLTGSKKPIFAPLYTSLKIRRPHIEAKVWADCHNRFLVIDGEQEIWDLGTSINHAGDKAFMIHKVVDPAEQTKMLSDLDDWWKKGRLVQ